MISQILILSLSVGDSPVGISSSLSLPLVFRGLLRQISVVHRPFALGHSFKNRVGRSRRRSRGCTRSVCSPSRVISASSLPPVPFLPRCVMVLLAELMASNLGWWRRGGGLRCLTGECSIPVSPKFERVSLWLSLFFRGTRNHTWGHICSV